MPSQPLSSSMSTPEEEKKLDFSYLNVDFNNIHDSRELERIIIELQAIIENKETEEREMIIRKMTEKNSNNSKKIEQYSQEIYSVSEEYTKFNREAEEEKDRQKRAIENTHLADMAELNKRIEELEVEYKKVKEQEELEAEYLSRIESMKREIITMQYQHNDGMNKLEAVEMKENQELELLLKQELTTTHKTAPKHAMNKLTTELKTNEQQNIILKQKLFTLQSELQKLKKERNEIVTKRKELKINVTLNEDELEEYKAVGSLQKAKIKAYKDKIESMKILISDEVARKEKLVTERKKERETNMKVLKLKLFNLEKEKEELKIKIEKMNLLAETILQQRNEIEEFFVMALDSCKKEIEQFEKGKVGNCNGKGDEQKPYGERVDIDELLPKDKQRILTNLYTKLAFGSR